MKWGFLVLFFFFIFTMQSLNSVSQFDNQDTENPPTSMYKYVCTPEQEQGHAVGRGSRGPLTPHLLNEALCVVTTVGVV